MNIVLATNSENPRLELRHCKRFGDNSGFKAELYVRSGGFTLQTDFYFERWPLDDFIEKLSLMSERLIGDAVLKPMWEDDFIKFEMLDLGHVAITGEFATHSPYKQKLIFGFETDQTVLITFRDDLRLLSELDRGFQ